MQGMVWGEPELTHSTCLIQHPAARSLYKGFVSWTKGSLAWRSVSSVCTLLSLTIVFGTLHYLSLLLHCRRSFVVAGPSSLLLMTSELPSYPALLIAPPFEAVSFIAVRGSSIENVSERNTKHYTV